MKKNTPDFFIIGSVKSGTTWLLESLNYHPDVMCFNEVQIVTQVRQGLSSLLSSINAMTSDLAATSFKEFNYYTPQFTHEDVDSLVAKVWERVIESCPKNATIYGEKCPSYADSLEDINILYPDAKYIHIVRDPRDVAISWFHHVHREKRFREKNDQQYGGDLTKPSVFEREQDSIMMDAITQWKRQQSTIESMKQRFPEKFITVRYEDFSPTSLNDIFQFIDANSSVEMCEMIFDITNVAVRPKDEDTFFKFAKSNNWLNVDNKLIDYMQSNLGDWLVRYGYKYHSTSQ